MLVWVRVTYSLWGQHADEDVNLGFKLGPLHGEIRPDDLLLELDCLDFLGQSSDL